MRLFFIIILSKRSLDFQNESSFLLLDIFPLLILIEDALNATHPRDFFSRQRISDIYFFYNLKYTVLKFFLILQCLFDLDIEKLQQKLP